MQCKYIDAHCHVQFGAYDEDREAVIARMKEGAVGGIVVGVDYESSQAAVALAEKHEHLFAAIGLHPNCVSDEPFDRVRYRALAASKKVVAIGECGLDYFRPEALDEETKARQKELLTVHFELAAALDKPLIIHARPTKGSQDAYQDFISLLETAKQAHPHLRGDMHFFVGDIEEMKQLVALEFTVSYTAVVTFARSYDEIIRAVPAHALLAETDAPYVPPTSRARGSRNDPLAVEDVVARLAEIRGEDLEIFRRTILSNTQRLFSLPEL